MTDDRKFETSLAIQAPREAVWQALTDAREIRRWFAPEAIAEARVGGRLEWRWRELCRWEQRIEALQPNLHLRTRYASGVDDGRGGRRPLFVDFHLEGHGGSTTLRVVHSGFGAEADFDAEFDGISNGWPVELRSLQLYLERHRGEDRRIAWSTIATELSPEQAWLQLHASAAFGAASMSSLEPGERFELTVPGAGVVRGSTLFCPSATEFSGVAENLDDGWLRLYCGRFGSTTQVWAWLSLYAGPDERVQTFQRAFDSVLQRQFDRLPAAERSA